MSITVLDARDWQTILDLRTGEKAEPVPPLVETVQGVLRRHPYPGDMDPASNRWVTDTALDLIDGYRPRFVFLTYAAQYFRIRYNSMTKKERIEVIADAFLEVERFMCASGFEALVVGTGDTTPLLGLIDVTGIDGLAISTHWSARYAGLYGPSQDDLKLLNEHPHVERIVPRSEILSLFNGTPEQALRVPEYLIIAQTGYVFRTISGAMKTPVMIPSSNFIVPVHAPGHAPHNLTDIRNALERSLAEHQVALVVMEGVGMEDFPWPHTPCRNGKEWYHYEPNDAQYLTITTGEHRFLDYPTGYKYFDEVDATKEYPFSGYFTSIPEGTFASSFPARSIAVGNKSMFMHMVTGADICVECFARNLYNQGTMAVIHRDDK
ncbi:hypothetical protein [Syntrophorhabdus aromaticivorans]|jgi:hypothetical protein|uniref:Uncharacterized protein n=1 Tax=Syntrophorhabdus aromaticivorans TaxID=328301 RepID=A0A971S2P5_9BACT|nr:hypothetical protein [Syntrophorhabdus aromaticivorans]NLW36497.1 hypothetical protein [Syntrophorhabdus aromaticivorans]